MKTYLKTLTRMFKKHVTRFISVICIVLVAVGFISGIGMSTDKLRYSLTDYYKSANVSDFIIKTTAEAGFSPDDISALKSRYGEKNVNSGMTMDVNVNFGEESRLTRLYFLDDFDSVTVNVPEFTDGAPSQSGDAAYAEMSDNKIKSTETGTRIALDFKDILTQLIKQEEGDDAQLDPRLSALFDYMGEEKYIKEVTVSGIVKSPLTFANDGEPSYLNGDDIEVPETIGAVNSLITLEAVLYMPSSVIPEIPSIPFVHPEAEKLVKTGDIYLSFDKKDVFGCFDKGYKKYVAEQKTEVLSLLSAAEEDVRFITLYDNYSFVSLNSYAEKVAGISWILMVAFLFVTALVVQSTMTRLMEEERSQIACLRTLGYSSFKIIFKYILFAAIATGIGGGGAYFVGLGLAYLICYVFNFSFCMPPITDHITLLYFLIVFIVIVITTFIATAVAGIKLTGEKPANLLRPKPPKEGRKVFLEKIPFVWNKLSFKYKSTTRNVLRYLNRFIMTVVSVAVSTSLVMAGLALLDLCLFGGLDAPSVMAIAFVVIIFAGLLTAVVIYTLTNINISERNRELATLKVLGYHDREVAGYIYREIYIDTAVGIIFGYPVSTFLIWLVFGIMEMGTVGAVSWFWWLVTPIVVLLFAFIVTLLLKRKIVKIDMNESLKAIE